VTTATDARAAEELRNRRGNERAVVLGIAAGVGLAVATRYLAQRAQRNAPDGLVDWERVQEIAAGRLAAAPGALSAADLHGADTDYSRAVTLAIPLLEQHLGRPLPGVVERHEVVDRATWAKANIVTFESLIERLEPHVRSATGDKGVAAGVARAANRYITTQQLGFLLGYLGTRVLGQYDIALLSAESTPGKLLFVEENVRQTAANLGVNVSDFRTWIVLHEATHAFEFEANSWIRPYLRERLEKQLAGVLDQAKDLQAGGLGALIEKLRDAKDNPIAALLTPEQRRLFEETQRVMSLLEGFSDWVMDEVGAQVLPNVGTIRDRFEARRSQRRGPFDRIVARLTGLDLKLEQYKRGERFVSGVAAAGGKPAIDALWAGPENLPSEQELGDPEAWVRRVLPATSNADAISDRSFSPHPGSATSDN
jgi:coenzyme F420 biosynthesis associated uncharacterized protein